MNGKEYDWLTNYPSYGYIKSILKSYFEKSCYVLIYKCLKFPTGRKLAFLPTGTIVSCAWELGFLLIETRVSFNGNCRSLTWERAFPFVETELGEC